MSPITCTNQRDKKSLFANSNLQMPKQNKHQNRGWRGKKRLGRGRRPMAVQVIPTQPVKPISLDPKVPKTVEFFTPQVYEQKAIHPV